MPVIMSEASFASADRRHDIFARVWRDDTAAERAVLQIAHGFGEHTGRYDEFARFLANRGFVVCGADHLGHGRSGEPGQIDPDKGCEYVISDMRKLHRIMRGRYPDLPYFLFGHSMGSLAAREYCALFGSELAGAIFCGTTQLSALSSLGAKGVQRLNDAYPDSLDVGAFNGIAMRLGCGLSYSEGDPDSWLSRSVPNRRDYDNDPLCGYEMSNAWQLTMFRFARAVSAPSWAPSLPKDLPVMLIAGAKDIISSNGRAVLACARRLGEAGIEPTVILYPGDRHEILHEDDRDQVFADVYRWLSSKLSGVDFYDYKEA